MKKLKADLKKKVVKAFREYSDSDEASSGTDSCCSDGIDAIDRDFEAEQGLNTARSHNSIIDTFRTKIKHSHLRKTIKNVISNNSSYSLSNVDDCCDSDHHGKDEYSFEEVGLNSPRETLKRQQTLQASIKKKLTLRVENEYKDQK